MRLTSNHTPRADTPVGSGDIKYDIIKIGDRYIPQKTIGPTPIGRMTEIKNLFLESENGTKINFIDNVKEIEITYGD